MKFNNEKTRCDQDTVVVHYTVNSRYSKIIKAIIAKRLNELHVLHTTHLISCTATFDTHMTALYITNTCLLSIIHVYMHLYCCRDFTRPDLPAGDPSDQATIPDLSAYGE